MRDESRFQRTVGATFGPNAARVPLYGLVLAVVAAASVTAGCSTQDSVCGSGQYPVKAVGNTTGRSCVSNGEDPPHGYVRYPQGKVPGHVGDKWDTYWSKVVVDKNGHIVKGPGKP